MSNTNEDDICDTTFRANKEGFKNFPQLLAMFVAFDSQCIHLVTVRKSKM